MIEILINPVTEGCFKTSLPTVPRIGETIVDCTVGTVKYKVTEIKYYISANNPNNFIEVIVEKIP